jgi:hypothetical protein
MRYCGSFVSTESGDMLKKAVLTYSRYYRHFAEEIKGNNKQHTVAGSQPEVEPGTYGMRGITLQTTCFHVGFLLCYSSTLKMVATCSPGTSVDFQRSTRRYIPEDRTIFFFC